MIDFALLSVGTVAQSVEQRTENPRVGGSIPSRPTTFSILNQHEWERTFFKFFKIPFAFSISRSSLAEQISSHSYQIR